MIKLDLCLNVEYDFECVILDDDRLLVGSRVAPITIVLVHKGLGLEVITNYSII